MELRRIEDLRWIDRNKLGSYGYFEHEGKEYRAELIYYCQANQCLSIKLGRHDPAIATALLNEYVHVHQLEMKRSVNPDVARLRAERRAAIYGPASETDGSKQGS